MPAWPVALPLITAALLAGLADKLPRWVADAIAVLSAGLTALCCAWLMRGPPIVYWFGGIQPRKGVALGIDFAIDANGAGLALLSSLLILAALVFSLKYFEKPAHMFQALLLVFLAGLCGFSLTGDLFDLFVFFELMSAAAVGLCAYKSHEVGPLQGAINFAVTNTAGAFITLSGIALLYSRTGALNLAQIQRSIAGNHDSLVLAAAALTCTGFLVKAAIVPFQFWLADAHAAAPTPACIVFSGAMVEAGLYAVARLQGVLFGIHAFEKPLLVGGVVTCLVGAVMCYAQRHLKRLLAFSTISHAGVILCGIALLDPGAFSGAALYVVGHGLIKASLFLCAGMLLHRLGSVDELRLHGRGRELPLLGLLFAAGGVLLAGAPPSAMFFGDSALDHALHAHPLARFAIAASSIATGAAVLRACGRIFLGWGPNEPDAPGGGEPDEEPETERGARIPTTMWLPAAALLALAVASAWLPREHVGQSAARMLDAHAWATQVLDNAQPLQPAAPAEERLQKGLVHAGVTVLGAFALAGLTLWRKRLPELLRAPVRAIWNPLTSGLRALHTGEVGDQVAWFTVGVAALGCAVAFL
jgi:multicomponent Na+:H+ antiporter subunit D